MKKIITSIFYLFFPLLVGSIVGVIISSNIDYNTLVKPPLSPPSIVFPIVWTILYLLMGLSYFLLKKTEPSTPLESFLYYLQLAVNALWSLIFFVWENRGLAVLWIILLDFLVILMIYFFSKKNKVSAYLNFFYLAWVLFATYLTIGIYLLNG